jgi:sensitive to high expression protein 9
LDALFVREADGKKAPEDIKPVQAAPSEQGVQQRLNESPGTSQKAYVADNITRVPDENLPSHRARQRWDLSKRFSEFMDDLLPKLAVVTQKVNTYTGTDYSGVEALRREIIEQGERCASSCWNLTSDFT